MKILAVLVMIALAIAFVIYVVYLLISGILNSR